MARVITIALAGAGSLALGSSVAEARIVRELHLGVMAHNIQVIDAKNSGKEDGPNLEAEIAFASPRVLRLFGAPKPYLMASWNVAGDTSFAGGGLTWRWRLTERWSLEPGLGYVVHDGEVSNPFPNGDPRASAFTRDRVLLGSRDLFRTSLGLSRRVSERVDVQVFYEHLSHGQILGEGRNQGLDEAGIRIGYRFGE